MSPEEMVELRPKSSPVRLKVEWAGGALASAGIILLVVTPSTATSVLSLALLVSGLALRPAFGPALLGVTLPFDLHPKQLGSMEFSLPELVLLSTALAAALSAVVGYMFRKIGIGDNPNPARGGMDPAGGRSPMDHPREGKSWATLNPAMSATPLDGPIALFLAAALLSLLASEVMRVSLRDLRTLVLEPVAAYYLATWFLRSKRDLLWVVGTLMLGGVLVAIYGLYQYFFTDQVTAVEGVRRIQASYFSPNNLGLYLGRLLPMSLALTLFLPGDGEPPELSTGVSRIARVASAIATAVMASALLLTFSIGAWLATALALLTVVLLWRARAAILLAGAYAAVLAVGIPLLRLQRISSHLSLTRGTSFIRIHLWQSSLEMIRDHPVLGVGMDNFLYHYRREYMLPEAAAEPNLSHPHNLVLNFWLQMGILGVAAAAWIAVALGRIWHRCWAEGRAPLEHAILAGIAGSAVDLVAHGMVDNSYFLVDLAFHFWLCAALVIALYGALSPAARIK